MSIDKVMSPASTPCLEEHSTCEACGNPFDCGATLAGCWCTQVKLSEQLLTALRARYKACLCRSCLESFAAQEQPREEAVSDK
ncbi:MAG TPA: cysteine-rich CWC family protein [Pyrinomonadaceae bacterium]|jgi:hypothetical protein|nr:cysteine-rich CWC family protein [Pyrinomonadaceae bacterium]